MPLIPTNRIGPDDDEAALIARIKRNHKSSVDAAEQVGKDLLDAKEKYGQHGKWGKWLESNILPLMSRSRVTQYMRLANELAVRTSNLSDKDKDELWQGIQGNNKEDASPKANGHVCTPNGHHPSNGHGNGKAKTLTLTREANGLLTYEAEDEEEDEWAEADDDGEEEDADDEAADDIEPEDDDSDDFEEYIQKIADGLHLAYNIARETWRHLAEWQRPILLNALEDMEPKNAPDE